MTYIKLTKEDGTTRKNMPWAVGITNRATGAGNRLCSDGVVHVYDTPEQAAFMRPRHCSDYTRAWEVRSRCKGVTDGTKRGIKSCTVIREIELPELTTDQRIEIAIRVSLLVCTEESYVRWANDWLSGEDRTADTATYVAAVAAVRVARAAVRIARAAAKSAVYAASAAFYSDLAIYHAETYASYAARAVAHAAKAAGHINLQSIIKEVVG